MLDKACLHSEVRCSANICIVCWQLLQILLLALGTSKCVSYCINILIGIDMLKYCSVDSVLVGLF